MGPVISGIFSIMTIVSICQAHAGTPTTQQAIIYAAEILLFGSAAVAFMIINFLRLKQ